MKNKFTLIELLVVIAIIAILAGMLLPALNSARDKAHQITCLSQMKSLWTLTFLYTRDYDDTFFKLPLKGDAEPMWHKYILPYAPSPYLKRTGAQIWWCPKDPNSRGNPETMFNAGRISYGFNVYNLKGYKMTRAKRASTTIVFTESAQNLYSSNPYGSFMASSVFNKYDALAFPWHKRICNVAWLDGHITGEASYTGVPGHHSSVDGLYFDKVLGAAGSDKNRPENKWNPDRR